MTSSCDNSRQLRSYFTWHGKTTYAHNGENRSTEAAPGFQPEGKALQPHAPQPVGTSIGEQSGGTGDREADEQAFPDGTHHAECSVGS